MSYHILQAKTKHLHDYLQRLSLLINHTHNRVQYTVHCENLMKRLIVSVWISSSFKTCYDKDVKWTQTKIMLVPKRPKWLYQSVNEGNKWPKQVIVDIWFSLLQLFMNNLTNICQGCTVRSYEKEFDWKDYWYCFLWRSHCSVEESVIFKIEWELAWDLKRKHNHIS